MGDLAQQVVSGLASGGIYASVALAVVLIYRSTRVINFAQGEMAMFSTFVAWQLVQWDLPYWIAFVLTLAVSFAGGVVLERVVIRPVEHAPVLTIVIVTLGLGILLNGAASWIWSSEPRTLPSAFSTDPVRIAGVAFSLQDLGTIGISLVVVTLLYAFFQRTTIGLAMRAAAFEPASSRLHGIRVSWMLALGWGIAAMLGAVAGLMVAPTQGSFDPQVMQPILIYAFAAAVLGGLDSPIGAVVGGLALGVGLNLLGAYVDFIGADFRLPAALATILLVLIVRPTGLFGHEAERRV
jgi:branched-chain amino acid transport system permease protein